MRRIWMVCEAEPRWVDAVYRFGSGAVRGTEDSLRVLASSDPREAVRLVASDPTAVVLWSPPARDAQGWFRALRETALRGEALHLVGLGRETSPAAEDFLDKALALQQLGATCVLGHLSDLPLATRFVRRYWAVVAEKRDEHPLRRIWQSLPWE